MKLATYADGSRDGQLVVVSRDLTLAHYASGIASRLQQVLDDWNFLSPQLEEISQTLNHGRARHAFAFEPAKCMAPLPRAYLRLSRAAEDREALPTLAQAPSDDLLGAHDDIVCIDAQDALDFGAGLAVITGDLPRATGADAALEGVRLVLLANEPSLHAPAGAWQRSPAAAFGPVAVTPDELLHAWQGGRVHLNLECTWNGKRIGLCAAGEGMPFHFGELIAQLAAARRVRAGSIVGSGPVSDPDATRGHACIAAKRAAEALESGAAKTGFLQIGDTVRIEMKGADGQSVFGAIAQQVVAAAHEP